MNRQPFLRVLAFVGAIACVAPAAAQEAGGAYPSKTVRLVTPLAAGSPFDAVARRLAERLGAQWNVPVIVENKAGAGGSLATTEVARSPADGYTLLITISDPLVTTPATTKVPYDPRHDFTPIGKIASSAPVLLVNTGSKSTNLSELVAEAKAAAKPMSYGSFGPASFPQLVLESVGRKAGVKLTEVPYRGPPGAIQDLMGNQIDLAFSAPGQAAPLAQQGRVRIVAIMGAARAPVLPNVPTFAESGFDNYFTRRESWLGLLGPARLPAPVTTKVSESVRTVLREPEFVKWLSTLDFDVITGTPEQFRRDLDLEVQTVTKFIREELKIEPGELR